MNSNGGTYVLVMHLASAQRLQIGKLGAFDFEPGWYLYVGSAYGPGGIKKRVDRHLRQEGVDGKRLKWHIDFFREATSIVDVWFTNSPSSREHQWARAVPKALNAAVPVPRFGSSDCGSANRCPAHLFRVPQRPDPTALRSAVKARGDTILVEILDISDSLIDSICDSASSLVGSYYRGRAYLERLRAVAWELDNRRYESMSAIRKSDSIGRPILTLLATQFGIDTASLWRDVRLAVAMEELVRNCGVRALDACLFTKPFQTRKAIMQLSRTADTRQRYRINEVIEGRARTVAPQGDDPVFDTVSFSEVPSRLARARGAIARCREGLRDEKDSELIVECRLLAEACLRVCVALQERLADSSATWSVVPADVGRESVQPLLDRRQVRGHTIGWLRCALKLTAKNLWDFDEMRRRGISPTEAQGAASRNALVGIVADAKKILAFNRNGHRRGRQCRSLRQ